MQSFSRTAVPTPALSQREKKSNVFVVIAIVIAILMILGIAEKLSQTPLDQSNLVMYRPIDWATGTGHNTSPEHRLALITLDQESSIKFDYVFLVTNPTFEWEIYLQLRPGDVIYDRRDREFFRNPANEFVDVVIYSTQPPPTRQFLDSL